MRIFSVFHNQRTVVCPDGTEKYIYKDVNKAIPMQLKEYDAKLLAKLDTELQQNASISGHFKSRIRNILADIDNSHASLLIEFQILYGTFSADPCSYGDFFRDGVERILSVHQSIKQQNTLIQATIEYAKAHSGDITQLEDRLKMLETLVYRDEKREVEDALGVARTAAQKFRR